MRRLITFMLILMSLCCNGICGTKLAMVVFIGDYPEESGWNHIASQNDKDIVLKMLYSNGFKQADVICLEDSLATCDAIVAALGKLASTVKNGDQVYIHFSCHGQQITDQDGDEALVNPDDMYDEAIVPYDAAILYNLHGYTGDKHLTDDVLNDYFGRIQKALGSNGCLLVVNDSCHSGGSERGGDEPVSLTYRGTSDVFEQPLKPVESATEIKPVNWISITACKDFQTNFEVCIDGKMYGRLSYAMTRCFRSGMTSTQLIEALKQEYLRLPMPLGRVQSLQYEIGPKQWSKKLF